MPDTRVLALLSRSTAPAADGPPDADLLTRFLDHRDAAALDALVRRHAGMVRAVCRTALADPADADDAFQATFLVLVRRARVVRDRRAVGGWLYRVAYRVARKLRRSGAGPGPLPGGLVGRESSPGARAERDDARRVIAEEVGRLPEKYRVVVQLCYVAGRTTAEAADRLGWSKGTVLTRLAWARKRLRSRLEHRGVTLAAGSFVVLLGDRAATAVPPELVRRTTEAAWGVVAAGGLLAGVASERALSLTEGVVRAMVWNNVKVAAGVLVLTAAAVGVGIGTWGTTAAAGSNPPVVAAPPVPAAPTPAALPSPPVVAAPPVPIAVPALPSIAPPLKSPTPVAVGIEPTAAVPHLTKNDIPLLPAPTDPGVTAFQPLPTLLDAATPPAPAVPPPTPAPTPLKPAAKAGKTFQVETPAGGWAREGGNGTSGPDRVSLHFDGDRITFAVTTAVQKEVVRHVVEADYSVNKESLVFGIVTASELQVSEANNAPGGATGLAVAEDQLFSFRFRLDGDTLTIKDVRLPGLPAPDEGEVAATLAGRYTVGPDAAAVLKPEKGMRTVPRRGPSEPPVVVEPGFIRPSAPEPRPTPELADAPTPEVTLPPADPPLPAKPRTKPKTTPPPRIEPKKN